MRAICMVIALCLPECGLAQGTGAGCGGSGGATSSTGGFSEIHGSGCLGPGTLVGIGSLQANLHFDPPTASIRRRLEASYHGRSSTGESFFSRVLTDAANHVYFGYELLLVEQGEEQQPGTYLATFGKLGLTPMEAAASAGSKTKEWSIEALPAMPEPRVVHDGDVIRIELMEDASTSVKLIDEIEIRPFAEPSLPPVPPGKLYNITAYPVTKPAAPTVEGRARDYSAADAELQFVQQQIQPRVTLNGTLQESTGQSPSRSIHGSLVWFYLPNHGRYILSLVPRPDLDFKPAGEVRGGWINFTLGGDSVKLEFLAPVATGNAFAPYNLYVLHDAEWEPTAQAQKGKFALSSVDPSELAALKRK